MKESYLISEVAARWSASERTIRRMIARGALKAFRAGHHWRIRREEIERHEQLSTSTKSLAGARF